MDTLHKCVRDSQGLRAILTIFVAQLESLNKAEFWETLKIRPPAQSTVQNEKCKGRRNASWNILNGRR